MTASQVVSAAICAVCLAWPPSARAQTSDDVFDSKQGAQISKSSLTLDTFDPVGIIGGATPGEINAGVTIFKGGSPNYVEIRIPRAVSVNMVELFVRSDNYVAGGARSVADFSLLADADGDGQFETVLVDHAEPLNDATANRYSFAPVTAASFRAEFTSGSIVNGDLDGPRVIELDAFEPSNTAPWFWLVVGAATVTVAAWALFHTRGPRPRTESRGR